MVCRRLFLIAIWRVLRKTSFSLIYSLKYYSEPQEIVYNNKPQSDAQPLIPVVIIPSLIGNQLWATLDEVNEDHWWCFSNSDPYIVFLDETQVIQSIFFSDILVLSIHR